MNRPQPSCHSASSDDSNADNYVSDSEPKCKVRKKYKQSFNENWLKDDELKNWIEKTNDLLKAMCRFRKITFTAPKKADLIHHKQTKNHQISVSAAKKSCTVTQFFRKVDETSMHFSSQVATAELQLAGFIAEHQLSFAAADHLVEIVKKIGQKPSSKQKAITLKRTKAMYTKAIAEGIGREESLNIIDVLKKQVYSILLDESTDANVTQTLAFVVRYVDANSMQTVDRCLDIMDVVDGTSLGLLKLVSEVLFEKYSIPRENLIGIGADNCATMMGRVSGFQARIKQTSPNVFVNGCICHSLALCVSNASKFMPGWIENFIYGICSYFSHSSKRKQNFEKFQELCDAPCHSILKVSQTRWLSRQQVVERILEQWQALHDFFEKEGASLSDKSLAQKPKDLAAAFNSDTTTRLYFLLYVLQKVNSLNLLFLVSIRRFYPAQSIP